MEKEEQQKAESTSMRKCNTCIWRTYLCGAANGSSKDKSFGCGYLMHTGRMRKCDPECCDKYQAGRAKRLKVSIW